MNITTFTGNYGLVNGDRGNVLKAIDTVAQTITLNSTLVAGWACDIENANTANTLANNALVLKPSSGTVDGASTFTTYRGDVRGASFDGTNWLTICIRMGDAFFNGTAPTMKNLDGANQVIPAVQISRNASDVTWAFPGNSTLATYLASGNATLTVQGSTIYRFTSQMEVHCGGTTVHSYLYGFLGSASFNDVSYVSINGSGTAQANNGANIRQNVTTSAGISSTTTQTAFVALFQGQFSINAAGTVIPAFGMNADPTGTHVVKKGTYFECWAVGPSTLTSIGAWS